jgi:hypothetical protein
LVHFTCIQQGVGFGAVLKNTAPDLKIRMWWGKFNREHEEHSMKGLQRGVGTQRKERQHPS